MKKQKTAKKTSIGGQAVLEGVMMRGKHSMATAVRDQDGIIRMETERLIPTEKKPLLFRIPILRGCINFFASLVSGTKVLLRSAEVFGESEPSRFEKWLSEKCKINLMSVVMTLSVIIGLALSLGLFVFLPQFLYEIAIKPLFRAAFGVESIWIQTISEGLLRIAIFIGYILLTSLLSDIRRTYCYHGAEHKTISCYEKGLDLTVENVRTCTRVHNRCGTTFMFFVMMISILVVAVVRSVIEPIFPTVGVDGFTLNKLWQFLIRIGCIPLTAGLSYELLKALAKTDNPIFTPLKAPGLLLQRITTKEPDDGMIEVAIAAFTKVLEMDEDASIPTVKFVTARKFGEFKEEQTKILKDAGVDEQADVDWIFCEVLNVKREELQSFDKDRLLTPLQIENITALINERATGKPLAYVLGNANFYGYTVKVDERVLIPRPETELLTERVIAELKEGDTVLDLCTGSGAIAITLAKNTKAIVFASDISEDALTLAKENAANSGAEITFIQSDLFHELNQKFNVIVSNPPYIPSAEIETLEREVKDHEPRLALDGGEDGLDYYREIAKTARKFLETEGVLFLEIGINQAEAVEDLLKKHYEVTIYPDYQGILRMVRAVRK
ncbi:MAG: peptide chain release factor N(5)-glutamine methyltransferase [Clostridiales bacterium]|nr:peptide chain release factor N(5)-glutamine methyltransferase [Clostridiales bacterium]